VKLGTGGLSRAYRAAAHSCLQRASVIETYLYDRIEVEAPYESVSVIYRAIAPPDVVLVGESYGELQTFQLDVRKSLFEAFEQQLVERQLSYRLLSTR